MTTTERLLLAVTIVAVDLLVFAIPLTAFAAAYVIVARPPGFLDWVRRLYGVPQGQPRRIGPIVSIVRRTALRIVGPAPGRLPTQFGSDSTPT